MRRVIAHIEGRDLPGALHRAVELWRVHPSAELGDLVDSIAAQLPTGGPLGEVEWRELALHYDPVLATRLLGTLEVHHAERSDFVPAKSLEASHAAIYPTIVNPWDGSNLRIAYILRWPSDPRTLRVVIRWLERTTIAFPRGGWGALGETGPMREMFGRIATIAAELADPRQREALQRMVDRPPGRSHAARLAQSEIAGAALAAIRKLPIRDPDPVVISTIERVGPIPAAPVQRPPSFEPDLLWLEVANNPDDDQPRHVLADALLEKADPRGLLIAAQLGGRDRASSALVKRHWRAWLGEELARLVLRKTSVFQRGMLHAIRIGPGSVPSWIYDAVVGHRELLVVREVRVLFSNPPDYARFIATLPNVTTIAVDSVPMAAALCARAEALAGIEVVEVRARGPALEPVVAPLRDGGAALTTLRLVGPAPVSVEDVATLLALLPTTMIEISPPALPAVASALAALPNVRFARR